MKASAEEWVFRLTVASATAVILSIAAAQILLAGACLLWVIARPKKIRWPRYALPAGVFLIATLISLAFSPDPSAGRGPVQKFVLFSIGILAANFITTGRRARVALGWLLGAASIAALFAVIQFSTNYIEYQATGRIEDDPTVLARSTGFMGHWMTFSGEQLLVWCAAAAALTVSTTALWPAGVAIVGAGLIIGFTRGVWLGAVAGFLIIGLHTPRRRLLLVVLPLVVVALLTSGLIVRRLAMSMEPGFVPDTSRIALATAGLEMVRDHPLTGVGLERVREEFPQYYRGSDLDRFYYGHLHNNFIQIAAERGLIGLAAFVLLMSVVGIDLVKMSRSENSSVRWTAISALAAFVGFLVSGLSEFNFGDSEVMMLVFFIVSIPYGLNLQES